MSLLLYFGSYPLLDKSIANTYIGILDKLDITYKYDEKRNLMELKTDDPLFICSLLGIIPEPHPNWQSPNSDWKRPINTFLLCKRTPPNSPSVSEM